MGQQAPGRSRAHEPAQSVEHLPQRIPPLPDIFAGTQLVVVGKYRQGGPAPISLTGNVNGQPQTFTYADGVTQVVTNPSACSA